VTPEGQLREWLDGLAALGGAVSAAEAIVADGERIRFRHAAGFRVGGERLVAGTGARFDAASLTKPWMATLALALDAAEAAAPRGGLSLRERLPLAGARTPALAPTLEDLLRHRAGMPAWTPLALRLGRRLGDAVALKGFLLGERQTDSSVPASSAAEAIRSSAQDLDRESRRDAIPAGDSVHPTLPFNESLSSFEGSPNPRVYSDLGYILWGLLAEARCERSLVSLLDERVCAPLGVSGLGALAFEPPNAVECRLDNGREVELAAAQGLNLSRSRSFHRGVPQDGNARALRAAGIFAAHAGLFVTADEMLALGREWLRPVRLLTRAQIDSALAGDESAGALGWARAGADGSAGPALSSASFGHTGFTGGSLWIDPVRSRIFVLLAHRLASAADFQPFRREFHRFAASLG
jgi:CubicO group peptidase (beta-lactamase class C family)